VMLGNRYGCTAIMQAADPGHAEVMRLLLQHAADPAAMMMHANARGFTALMSAADSGRVDSLRVLLDHPTADPATMVLARSVEGFAALTLAAEFAVGRLQGDTGIENPPSCAPLLLLLRRLPMDPQPCDAHLAHMTEVMRSFSFCRQEDSDEEEESDEPVGLFAVDQPNNARDECVLLLLEHGAAGYDPASPVMRRIISECVALARAPQLLNEAVMGVAIARQH
jgi:hypothetical protein